MSCFKTYINEDSVHISLPPMHHASIVFRGTCETEIPHLCRRVVAVRRTCIIYRVDGKRISDEKRT